MNNIKRISASIIFLIAFHIIAEVSFKNTCRANEHPTKEITLTVQQEWLDDVIKKLSAISGYQIVIEGDLPALPVSVSLKNVTIDEALRRILGRLSNSMITDEARKTISIQIVSSDRTESFRTKHKTLLDIEEVPPTGPDNRSYTLREIQDIRSRTIVKDPGDLEEVPPAEGTDKGVRLSDIQNAKAQQEARDPMDLEEVPPLSPGESGPTLRDVRDIKSRLSEREISRPNDELPRTDRL